MKIDRLILKETYEQIEKDQPRAEAVDCYILNAMNEYAEQESIAFAEWTSQTLKWQKKSKKDLWLNNETLSVVTTKELYHIYKNNQ